MITVEVGSDIAGCVAFWWMPMILIKLLTFVTVDVTVASHVAFAVVVGTVTATPAVLLQK